jgi:WD40 repeat protein
VLTLTEHINGVHCVAFHPTAPLLAADSGDNTAKLWRFTQQWHHSALTCPGLPKNIMINQLPHPDTVSIPVLEKMPMSMPLVYNPIPKPLVFETIPCIE